MMVQTEVVHSGHMLAATSTADVLLVITAVVGGITTVIASIVAAIVALRTAAVTAMNATEARAAAASHDGKLDVIHTLTNSSMTIQIEDQLLTAEQLLTVLKALTADRPSQETSNAIASTTAKVIELRAKLAERAKSAVQAAADTNLATARVELATIEAKKS